LTGTRLFDKNTKGLYDFIKKVYAKKIKITDGFNRQLRRYFFTGCAYFWVSGRYWTPLANSFQRWLSRLISGFLSDVFGRRITMGLAFLIAGGAYMGFPHLSGIVIWSVLAAAIGFAFGTLFAVSAPLVVDCFGIDHFGSIFGLVFTAFGFVSGALGPWLCGYLLDVSPGNFSLVFIYLGSLMLISALMMKIVTPYSECTF